MTEKSYHVLFLCTGNSARSIIGEALVNHLGKGRFRGYSAGSSPKGDVHPGTLAVLTHAGVSTERLRSKSWDAFAAPDAPQMDFVITVCDNAAGEACPAWPSQPMTAHWGMEDPAALPPGREQERAFNATLQGMRRRIDLFLALPLESIEKMSLQSRLRDIGSRERAATGTTEIR